MYRVRYLSCKMLCKFQSFTLQAECPNFFARFLCKFQSFSLQAAFFKPSVFLEINHWIKCHQWWNALHECLVVFRHTVPGAGLGRKQCGAMRAWVGACAGELKVRWLPMRERSVQDFWNSCECGGVFKSCECIARADKNIQPVQESKCATTLITARYTYYYPCHNATGKLMYQRHATYTWWTTIEWHLSELHSVTGHMDL